MPPDSINAAALAIQLQAYGAATARTLSTSLKVSQPTLSRLIAELGGQVERIGRARSTRYALRRDVRNLGNEWPIYRVDSLGVPRAWGTLRALHSGFRFLPTAAAPAWMARSYADGVFEGLPFFLQDIRPQGYLGRAIARRLAGTVRVPSDPTLWSDDDVLTYFLLHGDDAPGDLLIGDTALERIHRSLEASPTAALSLEEREHAYPSLVDAAQRGDLPASSAGGEQPKFLATIREPSASLRSVLVKFSPIQDTPAGSRWAELLACEHIASEVLRAHGTDAAQTRLFEAGGRRFLEVDRFDRTPSLGRRGAITLGTVEDAFLPRTSSDWAEMAMLLEKNQWMDATQAKTLRWVWCFGDLIANTDMRRANASIWFTDTLPFHLTPVYDMLPMQYRPNSQGEVVPVKFEPRPPRAAVADVWNTAARAAVEFWRRVSQDERVSSSFQREAANNQAAVERMLARYDSRSSTP